MACAVKGCGSLRFAHLTGDGLVGGITSVLLVNIRLLRCGLGRGLPTLKICCFCLHEKDSLSDLILLQLFIGSYLVFRDENKFLFDGSRS